MIQYLRPWHLPVVMCAFNVFSGVVVLLTEGRFKPSAFKFAIAYGLTIKPAYCGDLEPFMQILSLPG